jgi:hypothetical protein
MASAMSKLKYITVNLIKTSRWNSPQRHALITCHVLSGMFSRIFFIAFLAHSWVCLGGVAARILKFKISKKMPGYFCQFCGMENVMQGDVVAQHGCQAVP